MQAESSVLAEMSYLWIQGYSEGKLFRVFMSEHWKVKNSRNLPNLDCVSKNCLSQSHKYFSENFYNFCVCNLFLIIHLVWVWIKVPSA